MFCKNCGKQIKDGIRFCPACGKEINIPEIKEQSSVKKDKKFSVKEKPVLQRRKYNLGHIGMTIGFILELISLFTPNISQMFHVEGMTLMDFLMSLILDSETGFYLYLVCYLAILFCGIMWAIVWARNHKNSPRNHKNSPGSYIVDGGMNTLLVGILLFGFNKYAKSKEKVILDNINLFSEGDPLAIPIRGLGFWLCFVGMIIYLISSVITFMLVSNDQNKQIG